MKVKRCVDQEQAVVLMSVLVIAASHCASLTDPLLAAAAVHTCSLVIRPHISHQLCRPDPLYLSFVSEPQGLKMVVRGLGLKLSVKGMFAYVVGDLARPLPCKAST
jgi:hypothetical protein